MGSTRLYELTQKLVARGCPEHPIVTPLYEGPHSTYLVRWLYENKWCIGTSGGVSTHEDEMVPRDLWTMHALRWYRGIENASLKIYQANVFAAVGVDIDKAGWRPVHDTILEAIEAATRHLEPTHAHGNPSP